MVMRKVTFCLLALLLASVLSGRAVAAEEAGVNTQANNPLADVTAFNLHNYYIGKQTGSGEDANQFWLRYAQPFSLVVTG